MTCDDLIAIGARDPRLARHEALIRGPVEADSPKLLRTRRIVGLELSAPCLGVNEYAEAVVSDNGDRLL